MMRLYIWILALPSLLCCAENTSLEKMQQLLKDHRTFACSLYSALAPSDGNLVFSPYSISTCLEMSYVGARGITEEEMRSTLKTNLTPQEIAAPASLLSQSLLPAKSNGPGYELILANALFLDAKAFVLSEFRYAIEQQFKAKVGVVNFAESAQALSMINGWVAEQTKGRIQNLFTSSDLNPATRIVLANGAYFKGIFQQSFDPKMTQKGIFYVTEDSSVPVKMMEQTVQLAYFDNELIQGAVLPFVGKSAGEGKCALVILLPKSPQNFDELLQTLCDSWQGWLSSLQRTYVHIKLPKFILHKRSDLNAPLQALGMNNPFTTQANFSGIDGLVDLYLSKAVHEAYFAIDEKGVTAAAATGAALNMTAMPNQKSSVDFIADHPFLFFIVDLKTQEMLFMGKYADPNDAL